MTHVTFETAKRLKEAWFPQPEPCACQIWADTDGFCFIVLSERGKTISGRYIQSGNEFDCSVIDDADTFCPTATDILSHLPGWCLSFATVTGWTCWFEVGDSVVAEFNHKDNPAEACAEAWFFQNSKREK